MVYAGTGESITWLADPVGRVVPALKVGTAVAVPSFPMWTT